MKMRIKTNSYGDVLGVSKYQLGDSDYDIIEMPIIKAVACLLFEKAISYYLTRIEASAAKRFQL